MTLEGELLRVALILAKGALICLIVALGTWQWQPLLGVAGLLAGSAALAGLSGRVQANKERADRKRRGW